MKGKLLIFLMLCGFATLGQTAPLDLSQIPLFISNKVAPLNMLVLERDHKLYFEAYNDSSDIDDDGIVDITFKPAVDYYGYFDSYKCYAYNPLQRYFYPVAKTANKKCSGLWSGNFLNYVTTARLDAIRKVLYGGKRDADNSSFTILERTYIPQDGHSWGKEYRSAAQNGYQISEYTPFSAPIGSAYHLFANTTLRHGNGRPLLRVALNQPYRIWEWVSIERPVADDRAMHGRNGPLIADITDYTVRVLVCDEDVGLEDNCRAYPNGNYKPVGLLQEFGENDSMLFGLITGSYKNNLAGGVLRKNISSIRDEIILNNGIFRGNDGIISTIDRLTVTGFDNNYVYSCGYISTRNITNGECEMWGNPVAEMTYEAVRYFAGKSSPTPAFNYSRGIDDNLGLPKPNWQDPYSIYPYCSKANIVILSDIYPSYDSDQVPGSYFQSFSGDLNPPLNVAALTKKIFNSEGFSNVLAFIGQSGANADGAPTAKMVNGFDNIRGLAPEETNSEGSYYLAGITYYALLNDLNPAQNKQNAKTYVVGLSSPRPEMKFKVGNKTITIIPFGKSVANLGINPNQGEYQPTNEIIDFYIESLTSQGGVFRVNFADLQQGADFDMDAIVKYNISVNPNNTLSITTECIYAAGAITQHMGYIISGTTADGVYLEVRDIDTPIEDDIDYFLNTPRGPLPTINTRTFTPGNTSSAITFQSPLWYAAKWGGFTDSNNNNVPDVQGEYDLSNDGDPDNYFLVTNANNLRSQLAKAFEMITDRTGSFSSAALNSGFLSTSSVIYQAVFGTRDWSGQLLAYDLDATTGDVLYNGAASKGAMWDAGQRINLQNFNTNRKILTYKPSTKKGIPFRWPLNAASPGNTELDLSQVNALNINPITTKNDNLGSLRLNFLRGDRSRERRNGGTFRNRSSVLGDIINSAPIITGAPNQPYPLTWAGNAAENNMPYSSFKQAQANRQQVVYVGSNDGMLHGFDALSGNEVLAYVPSNTFPILNQLTSPDYSHHFYVDGSPTIIDSFIQGAWHTILVGTMNAGGQGVFALDVTNPGQFSEANAANVVKWEFTDDNDRDLGYTFSQASIVRLANGKWAAVFGNGYNNTEIDGASSLTGNAVLYIVDIDTGALIKKFDTKAGMLADPLGLGRPNGLASPAVVDIDSNSIADLIYVGDLFGNLWKIDISSPNPNQWDFSYKQLTLPKPFFTAVDSKGNPQPITTRPAVSRLNYTASGLQIYVGTGKYIETSDRTDDNIQTIYALRDNNTSPISDRSVLKQQTIIAEQGNVRVTSNNVVANNNRGWYMDLIYNKQEKGERIISDMLYLNGKIVFSTIVPSKDPCEFGGESWLMELNALTGSRLNYNVFDINKDNKFDNNDTVAYIQNGQVIRAPASGLKSDVGLISTPAVLNAGTKEYKYTPGTSGNIQKLNENPGQSVFGRQSWRQLQ